MGALPDDTTPAVVPPMLIAVPRDEISLLERLSEREQALRDAHEALLERERALVNSEQRFRRTFDDSPIGIALTSPDGQRWIEVNRKLCEMVGYDQAELLALNFSGITDPDDLPQGYTGVQDLLAGRIATCAFEKRFIHKQGHVVWARLTMALARDDQGTPLHIVAQLEDISERRAAEAAREEIAQRHEVLLRSLPGTALGVFDRDLVCLELQAPSASGVDVDASAFIGRPVQASFPADQVAVVEPLLRGALEGTAGQDRMSSAATGRTYDLQVVPYRAPGGAIIGAIAVARDVTKAVEQEQHNRMLATVVTQTEDAIVTNDRRGMITSWNPGAERLYGYSAAEAIGEPVSMIVPPVRMQEHHQLLLGLLAGDAISSFETLHRHKDGRDMHVSVASSALVDENGIAGVSVISRDISARVEAEAAQAQVEERLRVTVDHAPIGMGLVSLTEAHSGRLLSINEALGSLIGNPEAVADAWTLTAAIHPDDVAAVRGDLRRLSRRADARTEREVRWLGPDGHTTWVLLSSSAVPGDAGGPPAAVVHALDIGERKRFESRLQYLADHDALTGLINRRRLEEELDHAVATTDRNGRPGSLMLIDLDGFQHVNDLLGQEGGDELIAQVGRLLGRTLRKSDTLARHGGDEFAVLLPDTTAEQAEVVAAKLAQALDQHGIALTEYSHPRITASIGITSFRAHTVSDPADLLTHANRALREAKEAGRNRWAVYTAESDPDNRVVAREAWLERLKTALAEDHFELMAQPIRGICAPSAEFHELLIRLRGDDGELIPPGTFLGYAERFDLIQQIDRWVLRQAVQVLSSAQADGRALALTVNMSAKTFSDADVCDDLEAILAQHPIAPGSLVVEVTETAAIVNIDTARHVARELRKLGCRLALDDFGAGFASFYYLKHLEFDYVKIDGEFVKSLAQNVTDQLVVKSVVDIARGVGAQTVAEFVGDDETVALLQQLGVDYGQGYHLGHPEPITTALAQPAAS